MRPHKRGGFLALPDDFYGLLGDFSALNWSREISQISRVRNQVKFSSSRESLNRSVRTVRRIASEYPVFPGSFSNSFLLDFLEFRRGQYDRIHIDFSGIREA